MHHRWLSLAILTAVVPAAAETTAKRTVHGSVRDTAGQLVVGVTVLFERGTQTEAAISEESGEYTLQVEPGSYVVTLYYLDSTLELGTVLVSADLELGTAILPEPSREDCVYPFHQETFLPAIPPLGQTSHRRWSPVSRDRTHRAWIAPVAGADPRTAVTTVEGARRLPGAPAIPLAFVEEVSTHTLRVPLRLATGRGGAAEIALRSGSNQGRGDARLVLDASSDGTGGGAELVAMGPLAEDEAWAAAGLIANHTADGTVGASAMLRLDYGTSHAHRISFAGIAQAPDATTRAGWSQLRWISKLDDHKVEVRASVTGEQLQLRSDATAVARVIESGDTADRIGGEAGLTWRLSQRHTFELLAAAGIGARGSARQTDLSLAAGDRWNLRPNLELTYGVRADRRTLDREQVIVTSPRAALAWDVTEEGRSDLFVAYQRVPHVDDGDWHTTDAAFHDELAIGARSEPSTEIPILFGAAGRVRSQQPVLEDRVGVEAWALIQARRTSVQIAATTLGRVATVMAQRRVVERRHDSLFLGTSLRAAVDSTTGGTAITWKHTGDELAIDLAAEVHATDAGPLLRLVLGGSW